MSRPVQLASLFATILAAPPGCTLLFGPCDPSDTQQTVNVLASELAAALADGVLSSSDCAALCTGVSASTGDPTTTSAPTTSTTASTASSSSSDTSNTDTGSTGSTGSTDTSSTGGTSSTGTTGTTGTGAALPPAGDLQASPAPRGFPGELKYCSAGGTDTVVCTYAGQDCTSGRRPAGLREATPARDDGAGAWLAGAARLEAASVAAFERLADELRRHGAPAELVAAARLAADDERRHAVLMTAAARRRGADPLALDLEPPRPRPLAALARENAVEGCVRETWAALLAAHQARSADDPALRELMAGIADDERRHAELAWAIDAWVRARLSPSERADVDAARTAAAAALCPDLDPPDDLAAALGLPRRERARPMWQALAAALWAA